MVSFLPKKKEKIMQKKWKTSIILLTAAMVFLMAGCRQHFGGFYSPEERMAHLIDKIESELSLEPDQKEKLEQIAQAVKEKIVENADQRNAKSRQIIDLIRQETITTEDLNALKSAHQQKVDEMADFFGEQFISFHAMLSTPQKEKLAELIESHMEKVHGLN